MNQDQEQSSGRLSDYLLQHVVRVDAGKAEAINLDKIIGQEFERARRQRSLQRQDIVKLVGIEGFKLDEMIALENRLVSLKDIPEEVGIKLVQILIGVSDPIQGYKQILQAMEDVRSEK